MYRNICPAWGVPAPIPPIPMCNYCIIYSKTNIPMGQIPMAPMAKEEKCYMYRIRPKKSFTTEEALRIARQLGIDFNREKFDVEQFRKGLDVELEHGRRDPQTNVTNNDPILTGKIALAHLKEFPDYYIRLAKMEEEAKAFWGITD